MNLSVCCQTDVGLRRENNQDFFLFDEELSLFIVADGMGGHRGGEVASRMASETVMELMRKTIKENGSRRLNPRVALTQSYEMASRRIFEASLEPKANLEGMGTTLVVAFVYEGIIYIANVGDSRAYLFRDGRLWQITEDHSLMNEQLRSGLLHDSDVPNFVGKNVITRSVGFEAEVQVDIIEREVKGEEVFLMCSDGLSGLVTDERIAEILRMHKPTEAVAVCIHEAKKNGGDDNVTVMTVYAGPRSLE